MNTKTKITITIDNDVMKKYREYCKKNGLKISPQVELFMRNEFEVKRK